MRKIARPNTNLIGEAQAPGKIILTGEQFVVLGAPAVAMAIDLYAHVTARTSSPGKVQVEADIPPRLLGDNFAGIQRIDTKRVMEPLRLAATEALAYIGKERVGVSLEIECQIPVGAGLGSSASTTVAIIVAVAQSQAAKVEKNEVFKIAFGPESYLHGKPSGVDQAACTYGGMITFTKPYEIRPLKLKRVPLFLVCDTGLHRSTKGLVGAVVKMSEAKKEPFDRHVDEVEKISEGAVRALKREDDKELGSLMNRNQELLAEIGVSHPKLDRLVKVARAHGALGAKLTGAGGGGCIIALCPDEKARNAMARALKVQGGTPYLVAMDRVGAKPLGNGTALK